MVSCLDRNMEQALSVWDSCPFWWVRTQEVNYSPPSVAGHAMVRVIHSFLHMSLADDIGVQGLYPRKTELSRAGLQPKRCWDSG